MRYSDIPVFDCFIDSIHSNESLKAYFTYDSLRRLKRVEYFYNADFYGYTKYTWDGNHVIREDSHRPQYTLVNRDSRGRKVVRYYNDTLYWTMTMTMNLVGSDTVWTEYAKTKYEHTQTVLYYSKGNVVRSEQFLDESRQWQFDNVPDYIIHFGHDSAQNVRASEPNLRRPKNDKNNVTWSQSTGDKVITNFEYDSAGLAIQSSYRTSHKKYFYNCN
ncbi:MAG: hypothetical protein JXR19_06615 [Bacteroidia bacterium]